MKLTQKEKAYRAHMRRAYKAKHAKGIGKSVYMNTAYAFTDLYYRRQHKDGTPVERKYHPGRAWLRRRLEYIKGCVQSLQWANMLPVPAAPLAAAPTPRTEGAGQ